MKKMLFLCIALLFVCNIVYCLAEESRPEPIKFKSVQSAIEYINKNKCTSLNLGKKNYSPHDLARIKARLPEEGTLYFEINWCGASITEASEEIDTNKTSGAISDQDIEDLIFVCPNVKKIIVSNHRSLSNKQMVPLLEKYKDVEFVWLINLAHQYVLPSDATAFSTMKKSGSGYRLSSAECAPLQYAKNLKAVDLGHHNITTLGFLSGMDLELVILGDNRITDISVLGNMPNLQYAELFMNDISDISPLANCTKLLDLNLCGCKMRNIDALSSCTRLERLWISKTSRVDDASKEKFVLEHPDCYAYFEAPHASANDWRKHPRYKHYIPCLKSHVWIPFE